MQITGFKRRLRAGREWNMQPTPFRGPRHLWHQILDTGARVQPNPAHVSVPTGCSSRLIFWFIYSSAIFLFHSWLFFFSIFPRVHGISSDSASAKVKCLHCSRASLSLTSSRCALPSLQKRVPWDPSAPLLDGTSNTSGKQEWIKSPSVYKCIWKTSVAVPQTLAGMLETSAPQKKKKKTI